MSHAFTYACPACGCGHDATVTPERPAPPCSNPSSPLYSDDGDPGGVECEDTCQNCGEKIDQESVYAAGLEDLQARREEAEEREAESRIDRWREERHRR